MWRPSQRLDLEEEKEQAWRKRTGHRWLGPSEDGLRPVLYGCAGIKDRLGRFYFSWQCVMSMEVPSKWSYPSLFKIVTGCKRRIPTFPWSEEQGTLQPCSLLHLPGGSPCRAPGVLHSTWYFPHSSAHFLPLSLHTPGNGFFREKPRPPQLPWDPTLSCHNISYWILWSRLSPIF